MAQFQGVVLACSLLVAMPADDKGVRYLDIQPRANERLDANLGRGGAGNNFATLPRGEQTIQGVKFKVEDRFILLGIRPSKGEKTEKVEGIEVGGTFARLQILQGTFYGKGKPYYVPDDTQIGRYTVRYEDGSSEEIPIVYGQDVRDWWIMGNSAGVSRGKVAWEGDNASAKSQGHRIRLYLGTWRNPHPEKMVARIDFEKVGDSPAAPFCIGLTVE
jgi:hypothetical protein